MDVWTLSLSKVSETISDCIMIVFHCGTAEKIMSSNLLCLRHADEQNNAQAYKIMTIIVCH
jgi:hypothetical protein